MKNYIVIGATSGIGEVCAKKLSGKDNTLVIVGRNEEKLDWLKNTLSGNIIPVQYDLSDLYNIKEIYNPVPIEHTPLYSAFTPLAILFPSIVTLSDNE